MLPPVEPRGQLPGIGIDIGNLPDIAVVDLLVVVVLDLHHLVARREGPAEAFDLALAGRVEGLVVFFLVADAGTPAQDGGVFFDSDGVRIHYADRGRGEPVVLIHGFTGSYARHWESPDVIAALTQAGYRVIAMDCRGHRQSGKPTGASDYGLELVRDAGRLLDYLGIERAHVVGYSMGGVSSNSSWFGTRIAR